MPPQDHRRQVRQHLPRRIAGGQMSQFMSKHRPLLARVEFLRESRRKRDRRAETPKGDRSCQTSSFQDTNSMPNAHSPAQFLHTTQDRNVRDGRESAPEQAQRPTGPRHAAEQGS
jgi:hypothetical protein